MENLKVKPLATKKSDLPQSKYMKANIINKFPSMLLNVGKSGSGKTTVINYMLTQPDFMKDFFHEIFLFSPTAKKDDLVDHLELDDDHIFTDINEDDLNTIIEYQDELIEKNGIEHTGENSRVLIIFDDILSNEKFLKSPAMIKLATMGRHSLISSIINTQSYTKVPRAIRLQANSVVLFPSNNSEVELLCDDYCPPHKKKNQFKKLIEHATKGKHDFLFINNFQPVETRFRKNFDIILKLN
jgi:septin family protein